MKIKKSKKSFSNSHLKIIKNSNSDAVVDANVLDSQSQESEFIPKKVHLWDHLCELRQRLIYGIIIFLIFFVISYIFSEHILNFLTQPLIKFFQGRNRRFIYTHLTEAFSTYLMAAFCSACFLSLPFWAFQIWRFVCPAFHPKTISFYRNIFLMIPALFALGAAVSYYVVCPCAWKFFLSFESGHILSIPLQFEAKISEYIGITLKLIIVFGLCFQLPIVLSLLVAFKIVSLNTLKAKRKYAFLWITIIAAIITPPDLISPMGLILPVYGLYEGMLLWLSIFFKNLERAEIFSAPFAH
jgi:sec-independent protein translocase protein TatC